MIFAAFIILIIALQHIVIKEWHLQRHEHPVALLADIWKLIGLAISGIGIVWRAVHRVIGDLHHLNLLAGNRIIPHPHNFVGFGIKIEHDLPADLAIAHASLGVFNPHTLADIHAFTIE